MPARSACSARDPSREHASVTRVGYLSQRFSLYGDLSVDENIEFFADIHGVRDFNARRDALLEMTGLAAFRARLADRLSGGMKQKLALACTLVHEPTLIVLDEPTTGVDPVSRREFWKLLAEFLAQGITIVLATPYLDEAERCARVALLHEGSCWPSTNRRACGRLMAAASSRWWSRQRETGAGPLAAGVGRRSRPVVRRSPARAGGLVRRGTHNRRNARARRTGRADDPPKSCQRLEDVFMEQIVAGKVRSDDKEKESEVFSTENGYLVPEVAGALPLSTSGTFGAVSVENTSVPLLLFMALIPCRRRASGGGADAGARLDNRSGGRTRARRGAARSPRRGRASRRRKRPLPRAARLEPPTVSAFTSYPPDQSRYGVWRHAAGRAAARALPRRPRAKGCAPSWRCPCSRRAASRRSSPRRAPMDRRRTPIGGRPEADVALDVARAYWSLVLARESVGCRQSLARVQSASVSDVRAQRLTRAVTAQ